MHCVLIYHFAFVAWTTQLTCRDNLFSFQLTCHNTSLFQMVIKWSVLQLMISVSDEEVMVCAIIWSTGLKSWVTHNLFFSLAQTYLMLEWSSDRAVYNQPLCPQRWAYCFSVCFLLDDKRKRRQLHYQVTGFTLETKYNPHLCCCCFTFSIFILWLRIYAENMINLFTVQYMECKLHVTLFYH